MNCLFQFLISSTLMHIFEETMSLLPFATRTDMFDALKKADAKALDVDSFLANFMAPWSLSIRLLLVFAALNERDKL